MMKYLFTMLLLFVLSLQGFCQSLFVNDSSSFPKDVEKIYSKGLKFLASTQTKEGTWNDSYGGQPGVVGLCVAAMLAHGDDPNYGKYSSNIKRGINFIIKSMNNSNGYIGHSMYNHGFATLALAEAYGAVDNEKIGPALKKAVELILSSQAKNPHGAWRYDPDSTSADTTVSGAILVALLAAANAGVEIPDAAIKKALNYYNKCQSNDGGMGYSSRGGSNGPRTAIGVLVFALAKQKKSATYKNAFSYLKSHPIQNRSHYYYYFLYYASQAFFHASPEAWDKWNKINIKTLKTTQGADGAWTGNFGKSFSTSAALLSLALNYRFLPIYER